MEDIILQNKDIFGFIANLCTILISVLSIYIAIRVHKETKDANRPYLTVTRQYLPDGISGLYLENKGVGPAVIFYEAIQIEGVIYKSDYCRKNTDQIYERYPDGKPCFNTITQSVAISPGEKMFIFQVSTNNESIDYVMEDIYKFEVYIEYQSLQGHKMKVNWNHPIHENIPNRKFIGKSLKIS